MINITQGQRQSPRSILCLDPRSHMRVPSAASFWADPQPS